MKYIIENGSNYIIVKSKSQIQKVYVDENIISKYEVLKVLSENSVEPCHAQNVYDDLISK